MTAAARIRILRDGAERILDVAAGRVTIGRAAGQTLRIVDDVIAPDHAVLDLAGTWHLEVRAPLTLDGTELPAGARVPLARGARIAIAGWALIVEEAPAGAQAASAVRTASLARELMRDLLGSGTRSGGVVLKVVKGPGAGQTIVVPGPPSRIAIGRGEGADVVILDPDLSRAHMAFERDDDGVRLRDLDSKNGTRIGGIRVPPDGLLLRDGNEITAGATTLQFVDPAEQYLRALDAQTEPVPVPVPVPDLVPTPVPSLFPVLIAAAIALAALIALLLLLV